MKILVSDRTNFTYLPGIPGYGQQGAKGRTGNPGNGVYYASYSISDNPEYAQNQINSNKILSDNLVQDIDSSYMPQDILLDSNGNIYQLNSNLQITADSTQSALYSVGGLSSPFTALQVRNNTSSFENNSYYFLQENNKYDSNLEVLAMMNSSASRYLYAKYRRYSYPQIAGNWLHFYVEPSDGTDPSLFSYTYVVILPNGLSLRYTSNTNSTDMFIDNYYFYGCANLAQMTASSTLEGYEGMTLTEIIDFQGVDFYNNNENIFVVSSIISEFISRYCNCYVDIKSEDTGVIYRLHSSNGISSVVNFATWSTIDYQSDALLFNTYSIESGRGAGTDGTEHNFTWLDTSTNINKVLRLTFNSLSSIKIRIKINKYNRNGTNILPAVKIYVSDITSSDIPVALTTYKNTDLNIVEVNNIMYTLLADGYEIYEWDGTNPQLSSNDSLDSAEALITLNLNQFNLIQGQDYYIDFGVAIIEVDDGTDDQVDQKAYHTVSQPEVTIFIEEAEMIIN